MEPGLVEHQAKQRRSSLVLGGVPGLGLLLSKRLKPCLIPASVLRRGLLVLWPIFWVFWCGGGGCQVCRDRGPKCKGPDAMPLSGVAPL